ncbi:MAG: autotransporter outer membrane beta-barrel domain-containing protein [Alphaproteobacteria bacterium]|nr:MAG: autotransporter outer membrane beta-barrel domain-containing protein [Alphaproteobacteria bacterium]
MCCSSRPSRARKTGIFRSLAKLVFLLLAVPAASTLAQAQIAVAPPPPPPPLPVPTDINSDVSSGAAVADLGSSFLERLGNQATGGFNRNSRTNPGGGGASEAAQGPQFRAWGEAYGISATTGPLGFYDQSRTAIDVPLAFQSASLDLTQLGFNASVDKGPWTWAVALVHGFGTVNSNRDTGHGFATAGYNALVDGALTELSYYWNIDQSRIVPKAAFEYVRSSTGSFQEVGGFGPVMASGATVERSRMLIGAEVGHYWILDRKILDLSAYGKFVDNVAQNLGSIVVSLGPQSIAVQGIGESQYGADAGASASLTLTNTVRLYLNYDGKFQSPLQSHQGTVGVEVKW